ncbi:DUF7663 domain-containing protein [Tenacibaculum finnmarkense]|uniref:DUF7663 domain-containing protein n=1 Tax=Tenacibaculum finnmarkense genomovar ulcerans TaxID=2781388 RepID=A0A2I2LDV2_9FLAO|nr:hypothetical protein [Tenacibaculum finnmarkense]MBE7634092.1 hypothetical protein [Tenacibaculum finnmarkense genomovar ulcerans]MBE7697610.1 hypothetical protein [Tenacibaculum finnmarkense genomovar ulcerans]MCD8429848.1 hypothetical protein [Tenacibaculum finnmarkense genomovar ulcerans]SOS58470.1 hypothetical protein TNO010_120277 [Tenacibaculum finnmarkense genomovar ulcerans]
MKKRNKLAALFEGKTPKSKVVFDALLERLPEEPNIAWYPISNKQTIKKPVLYVVMENINFLDEILLKEQLPISHFIKVREGCGFGGNRKSISIVYAFLADLKTKYLLVDS